MLSGVGTNIKLDTVLVHCNIAQGAYSVDANGMLSSRTVLGYFSPMLLLDIR